MTVSFLVLAASSSCRTFELPGETCHGGSINGKTLAGGSADPSCSRCVEDECCDDVGRCEQESGCAATVSAAHSCVVDAGGRAAEREPACTEALGPGSNAARAYTCMRRQCGETCGLPVCQVDPSARIIGTTNCDRCFSGACCAQLNACYGNRTCVLTLECIVDECGSTLGDTLAASTEAQLEAAISVTCAGQSHVPAGTLSACAAGCFDRFAGHPQGAPTDPSLQAACLATNAFACAARAGCSEACKGEGEADK